MSEEHRVGSGRPPEPESGAHSSVRKIDDLTVIVEHSADPIISLDHAGRITSWNRGAERAFGYDESEMIGQSCTRLLFGIRTDLVTEWLSRTREGESLRSQEAQWRHRNGTLIFVSVTISPMYDDEGGVFGACAVVRDITYRKETESRLRYLADHDALTSLQNRRRFHRELRRELNLAKRFGPKGALLVIDLDDFKTINDDLGHRVGDQLISRIADVLRRTLRDVDIVARLGGDEFAVFMPDGEVEAVAQKVLTTVRQTALGLGDDWISTTASIGVAPVTREGLIEDELLARADLAMYAAKDSGGDAYRIYSPEAGRDRGGHVGLHLSERIRAAVEIGDFEVHAQPVYDMKLGLISQHELLVRMRESSGELVLPGAFLPTADRFGLIEEIDRWMVSRAIRLLAQSPDASPKMKLEVNLSARSMADPKLVPLIERELKAGEISPERLIFEVTETSVIENLDQAVELARRLKDLGCGFALDDFGAGFGSFYYLKDLPFDFIKIDGDFIRRLPSNETDQHLVEAITNLAGRLDKKTVAGFVEDPETLELLAEFGVDFAQGFHVGRPSLIDDSPQTGFSRRSLG